MKIVLNSIELQEIVTEALNAQGIDASNATFKFDEGAEIELNPISKPTKQKRTRKTKQEVIVGTSDEFDDSDDVINETKSEEETNDFENNFEDDVDEKPTEETEEDDDDSDSLFD